MKTTSKVALCALLLGLAGNASADFGVGVKAGTLGLGIEGRWAPIELIDVRVGINQFDLDDSSSRAGIAYDATLSLENYYVTGNLNFPLSPMRLTVGAFSNGNEMQFVSQDTAGADFVIGGATYSAADVGTLTGVTSFSSTAPYLGVGFDFELFDKAGLNLDFGVLWQGEPQVFIDADGPAASLQAFQDALDAEALELEDDFDDYKAWPVVSLAFVYNFD